jgi:cyclopropane fatty-acyl-phospholipid synthase-like methyltransferase
MAAPRFRVRTILGLLREKPPASVIDLGCGNGLLLEEIGEAFPAAKLAGVDISEPQVEENSRLAEIEWESRDLQKAIASDDRLAGRFDAVIAAEIIEHLDDPQALLRNARTLARPGPSRLIITTQSGPIRETERRVGHHEHFTAASLSELLRKTGWKAVRVWNAGFPFHDLSKKIANVDPDDVMRRFGGKSYGLWERLVCFGLRVAFRFNSNRRGAQLFAVAERVD